MSAVKRTALLLLILLTLPARRVLADEGPTKTGPLTPAEQQFVESVRRDLTVRFARTSDAEREGYVRYTDPDESGAISYACMRWVSDKTHPSQLWYDSNGALLGADFSVPRPGNEPRPQVWGVDPGRWVELNGHVHYVVVDPASGKRTYDKWVWNADFVAAGGSLTHPSAEVLVKAGLVSAASNIVTIFEFPTQWDLPVWLVPHQPNALSWD